MFQRNIKYTVSFCKRKTDHLSFGQVKLKIFSNPAGGYRTGLSLHAAHCSSEASAVESN